MPINHQRIRTFAGASFVTCLTFVCGLQLSAQTIDHGTPYAVESGGVLSDGYRQKPAYFPSQPGRGSCEYGSCDYAGCGQASGCGQSSGAGCGCCQGHRSGGLLNALHPETIWYSDQHYFQYEPGFPCPGEATYQLIGAQINNGKLAQLAFHGFHFHWNQQSQVWGFSKSGRIKVHELSRLLPTTPGTIVIDPTGDPIIDTARLQLVQDAFASTGLNPPVVLGEPGLPGLAGVEAARIYEIRQLGSPFVRQSSSVGNLGSVRPGVGTGNPGASPPNR